MVVSTLGDMNAKMKTRTQNTMQDNLDRLMSQFAGYVSGIAGDDDTLICGNGYLGTPAAAKSKLERLEGRQKSAIELSC